MSLYLGNNLISGNKPINLGVRNVGEIVTSSLPLTDAGLHLLDGSLILGGGIYQGFVDYIAELHTSNPNANYFCTETEWQNSVTQYGSCGKFVYDSVNKTVRLPKVSDILQSTTDINALGSLMKAGLPNIKNEFNGGRIYTTNDYNGGVVAPFIKAPTPTYLPATTSGTANQTSIIGFDASLLSTIYGNSTTVQPQTIKAFVYIVIANSTKTSIQVDIDEIATDLNNKMDRDGLNSLASVCVETYQNGTSWYRVYSDGWCEQGGILTVSGTSQVINFLKPYINTNYIITYANGYDLVPSNTHLVCFGNKTTNSITRLGSASWTLTYWRTEGYIR